MGVSGTEGPTSETSAWDESSSRRGRVLFTSVIPVRKTKSCSGRRYSQAPSG